MEEKEKDQLPEEMADLSEGVKEEEKEEASSLAEEVKEETQEESTDKLLKALEETEEEAPPQEVPPKASPITTVLLLLGLLSGFVGIGVGGFVLWNLFRSPVPSERIASSLPKKVMEVSRRKEAPVPAQEPLGAVPLRPKMEYSLILKHFLIPLESEGGAPVFVKATVVLYFENQKQVLLAKKLETPIRGIIFDTFKNIPFYYWRSKEGTQKVREALLETLKKKAPEGLYPKDLEVTGYILK